MKKYLKVKVAVIRRCAERELHTHKTRKQERVTNKGEEQTLGGKLKRVLEKGNRKLSQKIEDILRGAVSMTEEAIE